jgi:hypothetical protein
VGGDQVQEGVAVGVGHVWSRIKEVSGAAVARYVR